MSNSFGPDEAWITPSLAGQLGISHKNLEGEWANKYTRTDIHDTALARIAELEAALKSLCSEVHSLEVFETDIRWSIGNTNFACIQNALVNARAALSTQENTDAG